MCIFCEIVKKNIPSSIVYEDEDTLAILDLSQTTKGHTLVMPKKHYDNFLEMPEAEFTALAGKAQKIAKLLMEKLHAEGLNVLIHTNEVAGQTIMNTHIHHSALFFRGYRDVLVYRESSRLIRSPE